MLPTGSGKSLCYQYPSYVNQKRVLIISPLLSLMQDQVDQIKLRGEKRVVAINSFLHFNEKKLTMRNLESFRFIFLSPEMLSSTEVLNKLKEIGIGLLVIDEAHCISQWGPDFRPDYLKLGGFKRALGNPCTLALTATATEEIRTDIADKLNLSHWKEWVFSVNRPNITLEVKKMTDSYAKENSLIDEIKSNRAPGIVFFSSKKKAEEMQANAVIKGIRSAVYHGDIETDQRILIQQQFITGQLDWIFATNAFGMGINKENIRTVIHFHMPSSIENFLQEIGRAGRDGCPAHSILLYSEYDVAIPLQLAEFEKPEPIQIESFYRLISNGKRVDDIQQELMLTDTQLRVLVYYADHLQSGSWPTDVERILEARLQKKRSQVMDIKKYIDSNTCRRESLLSFFSENSFEKRDQCCDICGLKDMNEQKQPKGVSPMHWRDRLNHLLIGGARES
ncbi:hypothetical protein JMA_20160 [Jeotgalibacillus malaysiensis]|uniref:ATP-dependent DNA helicase RecQ n=1 Tax=Jeotgalibacillus malaysiensis TaxID=1508404 RepID=A0A0B5AS03_9BACL|nr:hypothetical protein JMA_20160 [Jeotgalibacillus malaysiensis]